MTHTEQAAHASRSRRSGLVALNIALLCVLGGVTLTAQVGAQPSNQNMRVRGEYTIVGGSTIGENASTIYVLDSANREVVSLRWNDSTKALEGIGFRDLVRDVNSDPDR